MSQFASENGSATIESVRKRAVAASSIGLGGIIAIVVVGTVVVALAGGLFCAWIARRNRRLRRQEANRLENEHHQRQMTSVALMQDDGSVRHTPATKTAPGAGPLYSNCSASTCCSLASCEDDACSLDSDSEGVGATWRWRQFWRRQRRRARRALRGSASKTNHEETGTRCHHDHGNYGHHHRAGPRKLQRRRPESHANEARAIPMLNGVSGKSTGSSTMTGSSQADVNHDYQEKRIMPTASLDAASATAQTGAMPTGPLSGRPFPPSAPNNQPYMRPQQPTLVIPGQTASSLPPPAGVAYPPYRHPLQQQDRLQQEQQHRQMMMMQQQMQQMEHIRMQWVQQQQQQQQRQQHQQQLLQQQPGAPSRPGHRGIPATRLATESALTEILRSTEQRLQQLQSAGADASPTRTNLRVVNPTTSESGSSSSSSNAPNEEAAGRASAESNGSHEANEADAGNISLASASSDADSMFVHESHTDNALQLLQERPDGTSLWESVGGGGSGGGLSPSPSIGGGGHSGLSPSPSVSALAAQPTTRTASPTRGVYGTTTGVLQFPPPAAVLLPQPLVGAAAQVPPVDTAAPSSPASSVYSSQSPPALSLRSSHSSLSTLYSADERAEADAAAASTAAAAAVSAASSVTVVSAGGADGTATGPDLGMGPPSPAAGDRILPEGKKDDQDNGILARPPSILVLGDVSPSSRDLVPPALVTQKTGPPSKAAQSPGGPVRSNMGVARGPRQQPPSAAERQQQQRQQQQRQQQQQQQQSPWKQLANSTGGFGGIRDSFGVQSGGGGPGVGSAWSPAARCDETTLAKLEGGSPVASAVAAIQKQQPQQEQQQQQQQRRSVVLQSSPTLPEAKAERAVVAPAGTMLRPLPQPPAADRPGSVVAMAAALRRMNSTAHSEASSCYSNESTSTQATTTTTTTTAANPGRDRRNSYHHKSTPTRRTRQRPRASTIAESGEMSDAAAESPTPGGKKRSSRRHGLSVVGSRHYQSMGTTPPTTPGGRQSQDGSSGGGGGGGGPDKENRSDGGAGEHGGAPDGSPTRQGRLAAKPAGARALVGRRGEAAETAARSVKSPAPSPSPSQATVRRLSSGSSRSNTGRNKSRGSPLRTATTPRSTPGKGGAAWTAAAAAAGVATPTRSTPRGRDTQSLYDEDGFLRSTPRSRRR